MNKLILLLALVSHSALSATLIEPGSSIEIQCSAPVGVAVELSWPLPEYQPNQISHYEVIINDQAYSTEHYPWRGDLIPGVYIVSSAAVDTSGRRSELTAQSVITVIGE